MGEAQPTILSLRAYGDFTILLAHANAAVSSTTMAGSAIVSSAYPANELTNSESPFPYKIIASSHLQPLYNALKNAGAIPNIDIQFEDFLIRGSLLRAFTNKQFFGASTLQQLQKLVKYIHALPAASVYLEQSTRAWLVQLFTKKKLVPISQGKQVYQDYANFFQTELSPINCPSFIQDNPMNGSVSTTQASAKMLILPTSRQAKKNMPATSIAAIQRKHPNASITIGYFGKAENESATVYQSFDELIELIQTHDFVYCPDSAQAHICQCLGKAHFMLYPNQYHLAFATPFVLQHQQYASFQEFEKQ